MFILSSAPGWTQPSVSLSGAAVDPLGWTVSGVEVSARETSSSRTRKARTDDVGHYEFRELHPGEYMVQASKPGFRQREEPVSSANSADSKRSVGGRRGSAATRQTDE